MANIKVTWEDQKRINRYGVLTTRRREIEAELLQIDEFAKTLDDASTEITLSDGGMKYRVADCFVEVEQDAAEAMLEKEQERGRTTADKLKGELEAIKKDLAELKVVLIGRFGDHIALDK